MSEEYFVPYYPVICLIIHIGSPIRLAFNQLKWISVCFALCIRNAVVLARAGNVNLTQKQKQQNQISTNEEMSSKPTINHRQYTNSTFSPFCITFHTLKIFPHAPKITIKLKQQQKKNKYTHIIMLESSQNQFVIKCGFELL